MKTDEQTSLEIKKLLFVPVSVADMSFFSIYFYGVFWIALSPTMLEAWVAIVFESLLMAISFLRPVQEFFAPREYRRLILFASGNELPEEEVLDHLVRIPFIKARHLTLFYFVKNMTFGSLIVVFYWAHEGLTHFEQWTRYFLLELFVLSTFFFWVYVTGHKWASEALHRLQVAGDLKESLRHFSYPAQVPFQKVALVSFALLSVLALVVLGTKFGHLSEVTFNQKMQILYIVAGVVAFISYELWQILDLIFTQMNRNVVALAAFQEHGVGMLPVSTISFIGRFQALTNSFFNRLNEKETELSAWVFNEAEKERTNHIGAISSLIAHDLAAPVTALKFCVDKFSSNQALDTTDMQHMKLSVNHLFDLSRSLRNAMRASAEEEYSLHEAIASARSLVDIEFRKVPEYRSIKYVLVLGSSELLVASIPKLYLVQILTNLFRNSARCLLESKLPQMTIKVTATESSNSIHIDLEDSGSGFSRDSFNELTADNIFLKGNIRVRQGLGLRMSLRMIEAYKGALTFLASEGDRPARFHLSIAKNA